MHYHTTSSTIKTIKMYIMGQPVVIVLLVATASIVFTRVTVLVQLLKHTVKSHEILLARPW
jgi:hypothetical protein